MFRSYFAKFFMFTVFTALFLSACSTVSDDGATDDGGDDAVQQTSDEGGDKTLTIAIGSDIVTFDIHDHQNVSTEAVHINMFNYLFKKDENMEPQPELVEDYEVIDDSTWEMTLKEGITFHNGDPLTSEDVKYTLERVAQDSTLSDHSSYNQIKEVEIIDDLTFNIVTHEPEPSLLSKISRTGSGILPKDYIEEHGWDHFLQEPIGTGPYEFVEWVRDDRIVFEPYADYFEGEVEEWDEVVFRVIPENSTRVSELLTGGVDIAVHIPPSDWERVNENEGTSLVNSQSNRALMLFPRHTEGYPTADPKVREAIDLAIDNEAITELVLQGGGTPTRTPILPGTFGSLDDYYDTYLYDVERAKELLAEAGYADGLELTLHSPSGRYLQDREVAETVAGMLEEIDITVELDILEWSNFVDMRNANENEDLYLIGLSYSTFDADLYASNFYHSASQEGHSDYKNEEVDRLIEVAASNMDPDERLEQYHKVVDMTVEDLAQILLHVESGNYGVADDIDFSPRVDEMLYAPSISRK